MDRMSPFSVKAVRHVGVVGRYHTPGIAKPLLRLAAFLAARGLGVCMETETAVLTKLAGIRTASLDDLGSIVDLVIVVGGDGTMLSVARMLAPQHIPLIGINQGRLGFLTDIALSDMETALAAMLDGALSVEDRIMLTAAVHRDGKELISNLAFNDVVVSRGALGGMIDLAVSIGDSYVCDLRADGVIIATPTGSTAYAMSAHGPIVHPSLRAWSLVPISPHALTNRPIVVGDDEQVTIAITSDRESSIHWDGHYHRELREADRIVIQAAPFSVRLLHPRGYDYFAMLRQKLHWSATPLSNDRDQGARHQGSGIRDQKKRPPTAGK
ncbi:MAG: NAD kinase [Casimicrobiaceae bacterium]